MIMYGTNNGNVVETDPVKKEMSQKYQIDAAMVLKDNLESNDIIDLVQAAIIYHDKLCIIRSEVIGLHQSHSNHGAIERQGVIETKWNYLNAHYNDTELKDPDIAPKTIQELLIKFMWLSYHQLPTNPIKTENYMNWENFEQWMEIVKKNRS